MVYVHLLIALLFLLLGYLIKYLKWSWLIAGYNTSSKEERAKYDRDALCSFMGSFLFVLAATIALAGLGAYLEVPWILTGSWIFFTVVIVVSLVYMNTGNRFKLALLFTCGVLLALTPTPCFASPEVDDNEELEVFLSEIISRQLEEHQIPGAILSIVKDGEVLLTRGYGYADLDEQTPVDGEQSLFRIGSVSKLITWTAVMQMVEQGKVDLDADVNDYLDFEIPAQLHKKPGVDPEPVTMRHLLTHTPGFEDVGEGLFYLSPDAMVPLGEHLQNFMPARVYPAGEVMAYSNYGSALAGYIVEQVSGQPFAEYVEENIFAPLGMDASTFRQPLPGELEPHLARAYKYADGAYHRGDFEYIPLYPAGSMSSTAADMARFMIAHLQQGHFEEKQVLQSETVQEMHRQQFTHHPQLLGVTWGFFEQEVNGEKLIAHNGATMLYYSQMNLIPEHNLGFFVTYSGGGFLQAMQLFQEFMDRYYPQPRAEELPAPPADTRERAQDYLGEYHPTRISFTSPDKFIGLLQALRVDMDEAGYLVGNFQGESLQFVEVEPGVYRNINTGEDQLVSTVAFDTGPEGRPLLATGVATYSKASWYETISFNGGLFGIVLLIIIGTLGGWLVAFLWRLIKKRKGEQGKKERASRGAQIARGVVVAFSLLTLVYLLGLVYIFSDIDPAYGVPKIIFGIVTPAMHFVFALPWVLALLALAMVVFTVLAWKNSYWNRLGRLHCSLFTAGSLGLVWVFSFLNML